MLVSCDEHAVNMTDGWDNACQASTKPTRIPAPLPFLRYLGNSHYPSHTYESLLSYSERFFLSPTYFLIWSYSQWLGMRVQYSFIYSFCKLKFWSPGTLLVPGPCGFELLTNFPTLWKALGGPFRLHLVYTSCPGPRINTWHWRKTRNPMSEQQTCFWMPKSRLKLKEFKKKNN